MKYLASVIASAVFLFWFSLAQAQDISKKEGIPQVSVALLQEKKQTAKPLIIDVRTKPEYEAAHIADVTWIPLAELAERLPQLHDYKNQPIYLVCASGRRSQRAAVRLLERGFTQPMNVAGGTLAWIAAGYPVVKP